MENKQYTQKSNTINPKYKIKDLCYEAIYGPASGGAKSTVAIDYRNFTSFLNNAYDIASKKEGVSAKYTKINKAHEYQLNHWVKITSTQKLIQGKLFSDEAKIQSAIEFGVPVNDVPLTTVHMNGKSIQYLRIDDKTILIERLDGDIVFNENSEVKPTIEHITPTSVIYNGSMITVKDNRVILERFNGTAATHPEYTQIQYVLTKSNDKDQNNTVTIELEDDDSLDFSIYDVFFSEDIESIYFSDDKKKDYKIASKQKEYGQLVIKIEPTDRIDDRGFVSIKNNRYQLQCQRNALNILVDRPSIYHHPLLLLSDDKSKSYLSRFNSLSSLSVDYKVLTDSSKKGNAIQQQFVQKTLQTPDFMILEGPPGSGKTTTILEFIYQALKDEKKVLLCASTHVAIDNVLEKMLEHKQKDEFLRVINPLRVGDEDNVYVEDVKQYSYKRVMNDVPNDYKNIALDSFNLVCGTTIGILQFPAFRELLGRDNNTQSIDPMFDYLIIDEASKTTFNEFLVPAVFAKRWVIVGDVKQLAPYVEKNDLVPTLIYSKPLDNRDHREAIYFLKLIENEKKWINKVFMMSSSSIKYLDGYIKSTNIIALTDTNLNNIQTISTKDIKSCSANLTLLAIPDMIIIGEDELVKKALPYMNNQYLVLSHKENVGTFKAEIFKEFSILHHRNKELYTLITKPSEEYGKKLEDEIIWRLIRMYELINNRESRKTVGYEEYINSIKNYLSDDDSKKYDDIIATISEIALPSIITLIQNGLKKKSNNLKRTILNEGFSDEDRVNRFVSLEYQYRMHSEISELPRSYVYDNKALMDDTRSYPPFKYLNSKHRFETRHVVCDTVYKNQNENEAKAIMEELDKFIDFAANQNRTYDLAVLTFYNGQVFLLRKRLQKRFKSQNKFNFKEGNVKITLNNVDKFQGQEADIVYLSMVQNDRVGFLDSVNRMNVAITRAKDKVILFGNEDFFKKQTDSDLLKQIYKHEFAPNKSANPFGW
jgi:DNA polymerase III delta prime subunit